MKRNILLFGCVMCCLILISLSYQPIIAENKTSSKELYLFSFNSYIFLDFDTTALKEPIEQYHSVNVPIEVTYMTNIPADFLWFLPWQIKNFILFGTIIGPMQQIHLEVLNAPDWGDIYITQPDIWVYIPSEDHPASEEQSSLIIRINEIDPSSIYTITIRATCESIGRLNGFSTTEDIVFTPQYDPCLNLYPDNNVNAPPNTWTNIRIYAKNCGNAPTRVTPSLINYTPGFSVLMNPPFIDLEVNEGYIFLFSVRPPSNFSGSKMFEIEFTAEIYPLNPDTSKSKTTIYIYIHN